eukprot:Gb_41480 [translate_table: standard]
MANPVNLSFSIDPLFAASREIISRYRLKPDKIIPSSTSFTVPLTAFFTARMSSIVKVATANFLGHSSTPAPPLIGDLLSLTQKMRIVKCMTSMNVKHASRNNFHSHIKKEKGLDLST